MNPVMILAPDPRHLDPDALADAADLADVLLARVRADDGLHQPHPDAVAWVGGILTSVVALVAAEGNERAADQFGAAVEQLERIANGDER